MQRNNVRQRIQTNRLPEGAAAEDVPGPIRLHCRVLRRRRVCPRRRLRPGCDLRPRCVYASTASSPSILGAQFELEYCLSPVPAGWAPSHNCIAPPRKDASDNCGIWALHRHNGSCEHDCDEIREQNSMHRCNGGSKGSPFSNDQQTLTGQPEGVKLECNPSSVPVPALRKPHLLLGLLKRSP